ncbi:OsmC family protein [Martelella alba]|nr:OsmC family protein [Martelella alba]
MSEIKVNLDLSWKNGFKGQGVIASEHLNTTIAIPGVYGGSGNGSNPKELYVAAIAACFVSTLSAILSKSDVPVSELTIATEAKSDEKEFTVLHNTKLVLSPGTTDADIEKASKIITRADKSCTIGNMAREAGVVITVNATVTH